MTKQEILNQAKENFGLVPEWMSSMPEEVLKQYWTALTWVLGDTEMAARDKVLIAFGAAAAIHCAYWVPFHKAQLALNGYTEEQIKEAGWVVQSVTGASAYLYGTGYDIGKFEQQVDQIVEHIKKTKKWSF